MEPVTTLSAPHGCGCPKILYRDGGCAAIVSLGTESEGTVDGTQEYETIRVEKQGQVDWVSLNRPEVLNAINTPMVTDLRDYFGSLYENDDTRIVVLRGEGRAFCAGLDIKQAGSGEHAAPFGGGMGFQGYLAEAYIRMRRCPQPIISLIHGPACGGGFAFALASDIRIAGESARMNAAFIRIGLSACDMGVSYFLPRLVGTSIASELMLTGRFIHADRALATGLVSEVVPDAELAAAAQPYIAGVSRETRPSTSGVERSRRSDRRGTGCS